MRTSRKYHYFSNLLVLLTQVDSIDNLFVLTSVNPGMGTETIHSHATT